MQESLESSLIRIHTADGGVVGAGFLVGERHILTCAHVVAAALGLADDTLEKPQIPVSLDVPHVAPGQLLTARVVLWRPPLPDGGDDIAGLELGGDPPHGAQAAQLAQVKDLWGHSFRVFGFPRGQDTGVWATGRLLGRQVTNWVQIEDVKETGFSVEPGFSGTPVWDSQVQAVVGMVVAAEKRMNLKTAFAIPVDVLAKSWPLLESLIHPFVFLCYVRADSELVTRLKTDLLDQGIHVWIDREGLQPGTPDWEEALRTAIRSAHVVLFIASPHTRSSRYVKDELRIAEMYQRPILPIWVTGTEWMECVPLGRGGMQYIDAREPHYQAAIPQIVQAITQTFRELSGIRPPTASDGVPSFEPRNPYKGLRAFTRVDVHDFFGREALVEELVNQLESILQQERTSRQSERMLAIVGPSGSGKSSVAMAGLLPALQDGAVSTSKGWVYLDPIVPGPHPLEALTLSLARQFPARSLTSIREDLEDASARGLHLLAASLVQRPEETKVVLLVDQFEELFTLTTSENERQQFIDLLLAALMEPRGPVLVLLTLRADFYDRPLRYPQLGSLIEAHHKAVLPMSLRDLRAAIECPAALPDVQLRFEGDLVGDMLFEVQGQVGALPLLQFTLDQLFQRRNAHLLTLEAYQQMGGVKGALAQRAEATYAALPGERHRALARVLFLRLIDLGATEQDTTRRRATLSELTLPDPEQTAFLQETTNAFVAARLLTTNTVAGSPTIEVSHEALIRVWSRLADWLVTSRSDILIQQALSEDVAQWKQHGQPSDRLYRGSQLAEAQAWAARNQPSVDEMSFLEASLAEQTREETEERTRQARELALQRQSMRRQRYVIGMMAVTSVILIVALVITLFQQAQLRSSLRASVTNTNDSGPDSLREAIAHAKPDSTITFANDLQGPIQLTREIDITQSLIISGPVAKALSISGQGKHRVFRVLTGAVVTILNLRIQDGFASNCPGGCDTQGISSNLIISDNDEHAGGAILNAVNATLTLINVTVSTSSAGYGAIFNNGTLTLLSSHISANKTSGLFNSNQGKLTLRESIVSDNVGATYGGGINTWGEASIFTSTISGNSAIYGGGLYTLATISVSSLMNSTVSGNTATTSGGGICSPTYGPVLVYSTIYKNTAGATGGGIAEDAGEGCGNYVPDTNYNVELEGSIVAGDSALKDPDLAGNVSLDYPNLIQHLSSGTHVLPCDQSKNISRGCALGKKPLVNLSPLLGPLQDNGGHTPTHALLAGSPALDQIPVDPSDTDRICDNQSFPFVLNDQRGESRPQGKGCDLGAYEAQQ